MEQALGAIYIVTHLNCAYNNDDVIAVCLLR